MKQTLHFQCSSTIYVKTIQASMGNMDLTQEDEEISLMTTFQTDFTRDENYQIQRCIDDLANLNGQVTEECIWMHNSQMHEPWDETGRYQSCLSETDGNTEHVVKPRNAHSLEASSCYCLKRLKSENERLKSAVICRHCRLKQVETLNLPCCHIVCCESCSDILDFCVLCEQRILGTVRIYMA